MQPAFFDPETWNACWCHQMGSEYNFNSRVVHRLPPLDHGVPNVLAPLTFWSEKLTRCPLVEKITIRNW